MWMYSEWAERMLTLQTAGGLHFGCAEALQKEQWVSVDPSGHRACAGACRGTQSTGVGQRPSGTQAKAGRLWACMLARGSLALVESFRGLGFYVEKPSDKLLPDEGCNKILSLGHLMAGAEVYPMASQPYHELTLSQLQIEGTPLPPLISLYHHLLRKLNIILTQKKCLMKLLFLIIY